MKIIELPIKSLREAPWNANRMNKQMLAHLKESINCYGLVENLVVRRLPDDSYEVISGNQRLKLLAELGYSSVPCVVVKAGDAHARLLSQALNHIQGEDDLWRRAELLRKVLEEMPEAEVAAILPGTMGSLALLASLGQEDIARYLQNREQAQKARLRHLQFQLTDDQLEVIQEALARVLPDTKKKGENPNVRGNALYQLSKFY